MDYGHPRRQFKRNTWLVYELHWSDGYEKIKVHEKDQNDDRLPSWILVKWLVRE